MSKPLVSICIPAFNGAAHISQCIESALNQTYPNTEIIITDDHSNDETTSIVNSFIRKHPEIRLIKNTTNLGLTGNWNQSIKYATGDWIKFLFQDDFLHSTCIEKMMEYKEYKIILCERTYLFDKEITADTRNKYTSDISLLHDIVKTKLPVYINKKTVARLTSLWLNVNIYGEPPSLLFHKSIIEQHGGFTNELMQLCDLEFIIRHGLINGILYLPEQLVTFRVHNLSASAANRSAGINTAEIVAFLACLLYSNEYAVFRTEISYYAHLKIKLMWALRNSEFQRQIAEGNNAAHQIAEKLKLKYPDADFTVKFAGRSLTALKSLKQKLKIK